MTVRTVHLHIGLPKSGTTTLQALLDRNRAALADDGVCFPGGLRGQIAGGRDVLNRAQRGNGAWDRLAEEVASSDGAAAVVSMETLCTATPRQVRRAVRAFAGCDVRVVVTARQLSRTVPAQWQESTQFRHTWSYADYLREVTGPDPERTAAGASFWRQHDLPAITARWADVVGADRVTVVTLPARSAPADTLWRRFAAATGLDPGRYTQPTLRNESLGSASAHLMLRVNAALEESDLSPQEYGRLVRTLLAKKLLARRGREKEERLSLPPGLLPWATQRSAAVVAAVEQQGIRVVGDLQDLRVDGTVEAVPDSPPEPPAPSAEEQLDAAVDAIAGLLRERARVGRGRAPGGRAGRNRRGRRLLRAR